MSEPSCLFSVVVPTRGRSELVGKLLISLERAIKHSNVAAEIIVIDDSSAVEREKIESLCWQYGARYVRGPPSVREKRNLGTVQSRGQVVFFTDSDCEVSPNIFEKHLETLRGTDAGAVLGVTEFTGGDSLAWEIVKRTTFLDPFLFPKTLDKVVESAPYVTCTNLSVKKHVLENIGGFDTEFPFRLGGDDTELGIRINEAGYKIRMNPDALVYHSRETWNSLHKVAGRAFRWGRADYHIMKKHPELVHVGFPSFITVLLLLAVTAFLAAGLTGHIYLAAVAVIVWIALTLLSEGIIRVIRSSDKPHNVLLNMIARLLDLIFEVGTVYESLRRGRVSILYKRIVYTPTQLVAEWDSEMIRSWSIVVGLTATTVALLVLRIL